MNHKATIIIELNYDQRDLAYALGEPIKTKAAFIEKVKDMALEDLHCYMREEELEHYSDFKIEQTDDLSLCCEAPIFNELQDDTDIFSGILKCEVCGEIQEESN
jgi:hypothetical protein